MKKFKEAEIKYLINQVSEEKISFSRMVEMINEQVLNNMLVEVNQMIESYGTSIKVGGYGKILRNKRTEIEQLYFKGDEKTRILWYNNPYK